MILLGCVSGTKKKLLAAPGEITNDADHPPIPVEQFGKHVTKMHKSDDRGFMIEYNASIVSFPFLPLQILPLRFLPPPLLPLSSSLLPSSPTSLIFLQPTSLLLMSSETLMIILLLFLQKLDSGQEYASDVALLPENKAKNRYGNIIACKITSTDCLLCFYYDCLRIDLRICTLNVWASNVSFLLNRTVLFC